MNRPRIGMIGYGSFGAFLVRQLTTVADLIVYDPAVQEYSLPTLLAQAARADFVVLAVPLGAYEEVLSRLTPDLRPDSVLVDICSVKIRPIEIIRSYLPSQPLVATHPLFGPESAADSLTGHTLVMCPDESSPAPYEAIKTFSQKLDLNVIELTATAHDKEIAVVQGLTFFVARALKEMKLDSHTLLTPSFARLLHLAELERHHSEELFRTIQTGNPFTAEVRQEFIRHVTTLSDSLQ